MTDLEWPYNLPIFRSAHRSVSPDGRLWAEIDPAYEAGMSDPTYGTLRLSTGLQIERCNPSFLWSDDSRYLAVPQFFYRFMIFRRQRLLVIDVQSQAVFASPDFTYYFQPESFSDGRVVAIKNPFNSAQQAVWSIPTDLTRFSRVIIRGIKT
ncbi:MAG: hypothetical protein HYT79_05645 [Elusimicrobia bacterium]|nr:hypothetical protein [Elusimicrobiota bacterium]